MKKVILITASLLIAGALIFIGCNKEKIASTDSGGSASSAANQKQIKQDYSLTCGTSNGSTDGFKMDVSIKSNDMGSQKSKAIIETQYVGNTGSPQKVLMDVGPLDIRDVMLKDSIIISVDTFKNIVVHRIYIPNDGKKYWFVPFDPKGAPRLATAGGSNGGGCCCGGGEGCYVTASAGCETKVCASACTVTLVVFDNNNKPRLRALNEGFTIVQADVVEFNGVKYE